LPLSPVLGTALSAILDADGIERAAHQMVPHARKIFHASAPHQDDGMFLEIVANTGNIGCDFHAVRQPNTRNFT